MFGARVLGLEDLRAKNLPFGECTALAVGVTLPPWNGCCAGLLPTKSERARRVLAHERLYGGDRDFPYTAIHEPARDGERPGDGLESYLGPCADVGLSRMECGERFTALRMEPKDVT